MNGYSINYTDFYPISSDDLPIRCLVYIGLPDNPQFVGPQEPEKLAEHIVRSRGPSGKNDEYLFMLEKSLMSLGPESGDAHIQDLAERVRHNQRSKPQPEDFNDAVLREIKRLKGGPSEAKQEETDG